ncbi:MAG: hypothetical protein PHN49_06500 [Candidatus Omnitrophica bacterium]|nr:hypothetical protein [Candidatus Omnitrophota bacterium]
MRGIFFAAVVAGVLAGYLGTPVFADQIKLKNGNVIEGEIIDETPDELALQIPGGLVYFKFSEISEVVKTPNAVKENAVVQIPAQKTSPKPHPYFSEITKVFQSGVLSSSAARKSFSKNNLTVLQQDQIENIHHQAAYGVMRRAFDPQLFHAAMLFVLFMAVYGGLLAKIYVKLRKRTVPYRKTFLFMFFIGLMAYGVGVLSYYIFPASLDILIGPYMAMSSLISLLCKIAGFLIGTAILFRASSRILSLGVFDTVGMSVFVILLTWLLFFMDALLGVIPDTNILETFSA